MPTPKTVTKPAPFGHLPGGRPVLMYHLADGFGTTAAIIDFGARIVSLMTPDRHGKLADVVLGYGDIDGYSNDRVFIGGVIGRYANRISGSQLVIDGTRHALTACEGHNQLHGGPKGFDRCLWQARPQTDERSLTLTLTSPDGDQGFPGALKASVTYSFTGQGQLQIDYAATTDKSTVVNLTQHSYFNLDGHDAGPALDHRLTLFAGRYLPTDAENLPVGAPVPVAETPFDFRRPRTIGNALTAAGHGFDHNWVVADDFIPGNLHQAALLESAISGRLLGVFSDKPGLQFYDGRYLSHIPGKDGVVYGPHQGICLEPQLFPDSPNRDDFPSALLRPGDVYRSRTLLAFSTAA